MMIVSLTVVQKSEQKQTKEEVELWEQKCQRSHREEMVICETFCEGKEDVLNQEEEEGHHQNRQKWIWETLVEKRHLDPMEEELCQQTDRLSFSSLLSFLLWKESQVVGHQRIDQTQPF